MVIDATGLKVFGKGEWHLEKHGGMARRTWRKLHLVVDPGTGVVLASALTSNEEGDASLVGPLLDQLPRPIGTVLADGAYDGEPVYSPDAGLVGLTDLVSLLRCLQGSRTTRPRMELLSA